MADTGPPWNLRFPGPQDFVRETNFYIEDLAEDTATALSAAGSEGIGPNVVSAVKLDVFTTTSTSFTDITGLSATITPSSATSRILLIAYLVVSVDGAAHIQFSGGNAGTFIGNAGGSRVRSAASTGRESGSNYLIRQGQLGYTITYLDAPNTDDPVTYTVQMRTQGANGYVNRSAQDNDNTDYGRTAATLTAIEVAA